MFVLKNFIILICILLLHGCFSQPMYWSQAQVNADNARNDAAKCKNYGYKVNTQSYANCMMQQDQNGTQLAGERRQRLRSLGKCLSKHSGPSAYPKTFGQIMGSC